MIAFIGGERPLNRTEFFQRAAKHGYKQGKKMSAAGLQALRQELIDYFNSPEGHQALMKAPQVTVESEPNFPLQDQPVEKIVDLLMRELE